MSEKPDLSYGRRIYLMALIGSGGQVANSKLKLDLLYSSLKGEVLFSDYGRMDKTIYRFNHKLVEKGLITPDKLSGMAFKSEVQSIADLIKGKKYDNYKKK